MGSKKKQTVGYKYFLGMHLALIHGPADKFRHVKVDGKLAWEGDQPGGRIYINKPGLFGGEDREGGIVGYVDLEMGSATQGQNNYLLSKLGALIPAFRGVVCAVLNGCYVGMNAYLKLWSFRVQRIHSRQAGGIAQWYDSKSEIRHGEGTLPVVLHTIAAHAGLPAYPGQVHYTLTKDGKFRVEDVTGGTTTAAANYSLRARTYDMAGSLIGTFTYTSPKLPIQVYLPTIVYDVAEVFWIRGLTNTFGQLTWGAGSTDVTAINAPLASYTGISPLIDFSTWFVGTHSIVGHPVNNPRFPTEDYYTFASVYPLPASRPVAYGNYFYIATYDAIAGGWLAKYTLTGSLVKSILFSGVARNLAIDEEGTLWITTYGQTPENLYRYSQELVLEATYTLPSEVASLTYNGHVVAGGHILMARNGAELALYRIDSTGLVLVGTPIPYPDGSYGHIAPLGNGLAFCRGKIIQMMSWTGTRDMNPAHIIRECLTDPDWGMGYPEADVDDTSFMAAADTLYTEGMGMSLLWDRQIPLEDFIKEVLKHIDAALYVDRTTGKFVLKLVRADYIEANLLLLDESNVEGIDNPTTTTFGELVNSITVNYWDYKTGKTGSVSVDDPAMIQMQGAVINTTMQYTGFTNPDIAARVAQRDLRSLSSPLLSCTITANRVARNLNLGDAFKLNWPDLEIDNVVMRVTGLDLGDGRSNKVRITAGQDVFAMPASGVLSSEQQGDWEDPSAAPVPPTMQMAIEAPFYEVVQRKGDEETATELTAHPDRAYLLVACNRPAGSPIYAETYIDSGAGFVDGGKTDFCPSATLLADVTPGAVTFTLANPSDLAMIAVGTHGQIDNEIFKVVSVDIAAPSVTVGRGCLDTCPRAHLAGASILFWDVYATGDNIEYVSGETVQALVLPTTGLGTLEQADAVTSQVVMMGRAILPYAPGNFKINTAYFPTVIRGNTSLALTWAHRDRVQQTAGDIIDFLAGSIGPEAGVTYNVYIYKETGVLGKTFTGITLESLTYTMATEATEMGISGRANGRLRVVVEAERAGYKSYQTQDWTFDRAGYGFQYGNYYGGI